MSDNENKKELTQELNACRKDINELKLKLNQLDQEKEGWFKKKDEASKALSDIFGKVKELKRKRNELTNRVRESKEKRETLNKQIKDKVTLIKKANSEKRGIISKLNLKEDPGKLKHEIERLELKIETEVMPFDKEQKLMKEIKAKKKIYHEAEKASSAWKESGQLSSEIDALRKEADAIHQQIKVNADESQKRHEEMLAMLKGVDDLKKEEDEAYKKFFDIKKQVSEVNEELKKRLLQLNELNKKLGIEKEISRKEKKQIEEKIIKEKEENVEDKIKKGKKLTTEDLLVFQRMNNDEGKE